MAKASNGTGAEHAINVAADAIGRTLGTIAGKVDALREEHPHPIDEIRAAVAEGQDRAAEITAIAKAKVNAGVKSVKSAVKSTKKVVKSTKKTVAKTRARSKAVARKVKKTAAKRTATAKKSAGRAKKTVKKTVRKTVARGRKAAKRRR